MLKRSMNGEEELSDPAMPPVIGDSLFHRLLDNLPAGAYTCDREGLITYFNEHAVRLWGRAPELRNPADRFCGSFKIYTADGAPLTHDRCWMALALAEEKEYNGAELVVERPDGERLNVLAHANPIRNDDGQVVGAVNVLVDISDQKRVETALAEADHVKSEFLATMSHEIRTPINAVLGYLDLLNLEIAGPLTDGQRRQLARVHAASRHLLSLVDQVLDLSRLDADQMVVRRDTLRAVETADAAISVVQPLAGARGITLTSTIPADWAGSYVGDEDRVRQMLINLLSNAIKFGEPGGSVEISCEAGDRPEIGPAPGIDAGPWLRFRVSDDGAGIPPGQLARIFEPFVQLEPSRTRTRGGTGLGLTISRRLARTMGGDLVGDSVEGEGSTFTVWLPAGNAGSVRGQPAQPSATPPPPAAAAGFSAAGHLLLASVDAIVTDHVERIRAEALGPGAASLGGPQLGNHAAMLVTHVAVSLLAVDTPAATSAMLESGSEIMKVCATELGRQRASFGWDAPAVSREYDILTDELLRRVRRSPPEDVPDPVLAVIRCRLDQAKKFSIQALISQA